METLTYQQFIDGINKGEIIKAVFQVKDYAHYRYCSIERDAVTYNDGSSSIRIYVHLTKNYYIGQYGHIYGNFMFVDKFDEKCKLFKMGHKGTFNLKQMWESIEFISIDYVP